MLVNHIIVFDYVEHDTYHNQVKFRKKIRKVKDNGIILGFHGTSNKHQNSKFKNQTNSKNLTRIPILHINCINMQTHL